MQKWRYVKNFAFVNIKPLGVFLPLPRWDASPPQGYPSPPSSTPWPALGSFSDDDGYGGDEFLLKKVFSFYL